MSATETFLIDLARLERQGPDGNLIVRLMRAADDIALANWGLRQFTENPPGGLSQHLQLGARRYFVRLQCGHLFEGIKLISEVQGSPALAALVQKCEQDIQETFSRLRQYVRGGPLRHDFEQRVGLIRHKAAFHYDRKLIGAALTNRANRHGSSLSTITRGTEISLWRSGLADDIEDTLVCRLLWQIPFSADVGVEADKYLDFGAGICRDFLDFTGAFSFHFLREWATV